MSTSEQSLVPYAPDFTPATLGRRMGEDEVLSWLLDAIGDGSRRDDVTATICEEGLAHIKNDRDRRDMASHVLSGLRGYGLVYDEGSLITLTEVGTQLRAVPGEQQDVLFARHILTQCNGHRLLDEIRAYTLRGTKPTLEDLAAKLDRHPTSKNVSTMRAWLARAGIFPAAKSYVIDEAAVARILGDDVENLFGLDRHQVEFVMAARLLTLETGQEEHRASEIVSVAESRSPNLRYRRKSLDSFVRVLEEHAVLERRLAYGRGGSGTVVRLLEQASLLADDQLRSLLEQADAGFPLHKLRPLDKVLAALNVGTAYDRGLAGEMLAVHICLLLGLRVRGWRTRAPHAEIDLIAERVSALTYQRWVVQVKNTDGALDADRVDREIGAVAGTAVTHVLFVVPRAELTNPARAEIIARSRLTPLHVFYLAASTMDAGVEARRLLRELDQQLGALTLAKREEAVRRETA